MVDPFVILAPVLLLAIVALLRFVGCEKVFPLVGPDPVRVTFDNPPPPSPSPSPLDGDYPPPPGDKKLNFGAGQWEWASQSFNNIFFANAPGGMPAGRSFSFANGPRVLTSLEVLTITAGVITLRDANGRTKSQTITTGPIQTVPTDWTDQPSAAITVEFTAGSDLGITAITYGGGL